MIIFPILICIAFIGLVYTAIHGSLERIKLKKEINISSERFLKLFEFVKKQNIKKIEGIEYLNKNKSVNIRFKDHYRRDFKFPTSENNGKVVMRMNDLTDIKTYYERIMTLDIKRRKVGIENQIDELISKFGEDLKPFLREERLKKVLG